MLGQLLGNRAARQKSQAMALKRHGLELTIMTSGINEVSAEQHSESVLRTAAKLGVKRFRMHYFKYDLSKPIWPQLQEIRPKLRDLVAELRLPGVRVDF